MPVEGQTKRLARGLDRRDKHVLAAFAGAVVLGVGSCGYVYATHSPAPASADCVVVTVPSTIGGQTLRNCGNAARTFCRSEASLNETVASACRERGYAIERPNG